MNQMIIHVDMDAFYASVEVRDHPSMKGKALIIGSMPHERGVVATCSYEARKYGIHSAMNIKEAYRLCPSGVYMHPNMEKYRLVSDQLHDIWKQYAVESEKIALDEAYLDVTETAGSWERACEMAHTIKRRTWEELKLSCSVGVAYCKMAAKTASEEKKPDGYFEIRTPEDFVDLVIDRDIRVLHTVGEKTAEKLYRAGIYRVRDLRERTEDVIRLLGRHGRLITDLAFGIDDRRVVPYRPEDAKSISREYTFQEDVHDFSFLKDVLFLLSLSVEYRARRYGLYGKGVTLKLTYGNMKNITRSRLVSYADSAVTIFDEAVQMLDQVNKQPVRLIGVGIYQLENENSRQLRIEDFLEETAVRQIQCRDEELARLGRRYHLDFAGHLEQLYQLDTLHKTIEYMRKHKQT